MVDPKLFEVLGKYAGLGGFSIIGIVMLLFMAILRKNFPGPNHAKQLM